MVVKSVVPAAETILSVGQNMLVLHPLSEAIIPKQGEHFQQAGFEANQTIGGRVCSILARFKNARIVIIYIRGADRRSRHELKNRTRASTDSFVKSLYVVVSKRVWFLDIGQHDLDS